MIFCSSNSFALQSSIHSPNASKDNKIDFIKKQDEAYLQRHYPFYFAYNAHLSKIQVSFKTPITKQLPIYFAYTQLMFWELRENSKPFSDFTYNPELYYHLKLKDFILLKSIDFGIFNHTSNGKDGVESRSFNRLNIKANFDKEFSKWILSFYVQWSHLYDIAEDNRDIRTYISPLAVGFSMVQLFDYWLDKSEITFQLIPGGREGSEIDLGGYLASWSFRPGGLNIVPAFYMQYYTGFAETLLNYDKRVDVFRVGLIF
jgi:phospholipase A1